MHSEPLPNISITRLLLVLVGFVLGVWWLIGWSVNHDPLWFYTSFGETPSRIRVYHRGQTVELQPGQPGFSQLTQAFNADFSRRRGWSTLGVSQDGLEEYKQRGTALEMRYPRPVTIRSQYLYGPHSALFLPLTGRHSDTNPVWGLDGDTLVPGAMHLDSTAAIRDALAALGYGP
jgi:hypothetical protein